MYTYTYWKDMISIYLSAKNQNIVAKIQVFGAKMSKCGAKFNNHRQNWN